MIETDDISNSNECLNSECGHFHFGEICQHCHHDDGKNSGMDQGGACHDVEVDLRWIDMEGAVNGSGMDLGGAGHGGENMWK